MRRATFDSSNKGGGGEEREDKVQLGLVHMGVPYSSSPNIKATFLALWGNKRYTLLDDRRTWRRAPGGVRLNYWTRSRANGRDLALLAKPFREDTTICCFTHSRRKTADLFSKNKPALVVLHHSSTQCSALHCCYGGYKIDFMFLVSRYLQNHFAYYVRGQHYLLLRTFSQKNSWSVFKNQAGLGSVAPCSSTQCSTLLLRGV